MQIQPVLGADGASPEDVLLEGGVDSPQALSKNIAVSAAALIS